jgi:tRNA pseudouridine13 synthase
MERAALSVLARENQTLADLRVKDAPQIHFDAEERPLVVHPGKLVVGEARKDELNRGRLRVNLAFTLPPGAYATLVVKRLFWWTLQPGAKREAERKAPVARPAPTQAEKVEERRRTGFLAAKRARREARKKGPA